MSYSSFSLDDGMRKLISAIEAMPYFDEKWIAERSGLGDEALALFRNYVLGRGLIPKASVNYGKLGLREVVVVMSLPINDQFLAKGVGEVFQKAGFLISWARPFGSKTLITRHAVPPSYLKNYLETLDYAKGLGLLTEFSTLEFGEAHSRFSFEPSVFDYSQGTWKESVSPAPKRKPSFSDPSPARHLDEVDLKILSALKVSATQNLRTLAKSLRLDEKELAWHLNEHVLGGGDKRSSMINSYYLDFLQPSVFAASTVFADGFFMGVDSGQHEALLDELLQIPYLVFLRGNGNVHATFALPLSKLYYMADSIDKAALGAGVKNYEYYVTPWFSLSLFGVAQELGIGQNFKDGHWVFDQELVREELEVLARTYGGGQSANLK